MWADCIIYQGVLKYNRMPPPQKKLAWSSCDVWKCSISLEINKTTFLVLCPFVHVCSLCLVFINWMLAKDLFSFLSVAEEVVRHCHVFSAPKNFGYGFKSTYNFLKILYLDYVMLRARGVNWRAVLSVRILIMTLKRLLFFVILICTLSLALCSHSVTEFDYLGS